MRFGRRSQVVGLALVAMSTSGCVFITRSSVSSSEAQADGQNDYPSVSADGRYVAFQSLATNLVSGDTNGFGDVFVRDHQTGDTERVSVDSSGTQADGESLNAAISSEGRNVAFVSAATNLVPADTNGTYDVFVHDRDTDITERVSVDSTGTQADFGGDAAAISGDGRYVAFQSFGSNLVAGDTNGANDVFVHDRDTGVTERVSLDSTGAQADFGSSQPSISGDGRYVAFASDATNLVPGDTNGIQDVFVHDRTNGWTQRASLGVFYQQADTFSFLPSISGDGRYVAFESATNLVDNDTNGVADVYLKFALAPRPLATVGSTSIARGTTGQITITGSWFDPNFLQVAVGPFEGTTVDQVSVQNPNTTAVVTITVAADAETGSRDFYVTNPGNAWNVNAVGSDVCNDCLTIT
jgi:hypothetical protein